MQTGEVEFPERTIRDTFDLKSFIVDLIDYIQDLKQEIKDFEQNESLEVEAMRIERDEAEGYAQDLERENIGLRKDIENLKKMNNILAEERDFYKSLGGIK